MECKDGQIDKYKVAHSSLLTPIQHTEDTKDVPSGKRGRHRPMEYARPWNMKCRSPQTWHPERSNLKYLSNDFKLIKISTG